MRKADPRNLRLMEYTPGECVLQSVSARRGIWGTRILNSQQTALHDTWEWGHWHDVRKYTYTDGLTSEQMSEVCFENYDPAFRNTARDDDILVSGFNFGCGSSWVTFSDLFFISSCCRPGTFPVPWICVFIPELSLESNTDSVIIQSRASRYRDSCQENPPCGSR